ncbi:bifunctional serine/threonine-protein kinase/ABC transporter substrate-binding protein [Actinomadura sp. HBU206391]|uniref:bifunctional serine/threonine-protein kinase/ABC transporter substrate-binding protein n=1 Tax=Actinomadura sp. HBU206391 TaxID=2731692 RepID=UPI001650975E|nr:bifunctional serine/threonine-protein kinase/ABC transporter substrate-binding protein [Actinomadura sp. HBU206391]MBC6463039.1 ABC transporter substrate-binding protein [Actinomadura sp. HBU206391]
MAEAQPLLPGDPQRLGDYELIGRLGEGGQGVVFLGRGTGGRQVAVKLLLAQLTGDAAARSRFVRELAVAERVAGFCTAQVLDADVAGDQPYIVSEYVSGPSLKDLVQREGPREGSALIRLAIGTATALAAIHQAGIVHRDLKPLNVLMGPDGPRVIDFGVARALDTTAVTMTSQVVGTPAYMAPEQLAGGPVGAAADMFAWGSTMVFAATGESPFGSDSIPAVMHRIINLNPELSVLPEPLRELVAGCLSKDPARRPTAHGVLLRLLGGIGAPPPAVAGDRIEPALTRGATAATAATDPRPGQRRGRPPRAVPQVTSPEPGGGPARPVRRVNRTVMLALGLPAAVVVTVLIAVAGYAVFAGDGDPAAGAPGTVRIGFAGGLTGEYADIVRPMLNSAKLAVKEYNATSPSVRAELVLADTQGVAEHTSAAAHRLVSDGVVGVVGPPFSGESEVAAPIFDEAGVPNVSTAATGRALSGRGWRFWHRLVPGDQGVASSAADFLARTTEPKRVFVADDDLMYTQNAALDVSGVLRARGIKVTEGRFSQRATDLSAMVDKIRKSKAEAVFYGGAYGPAARLVKQTHAAGVKARFNLTDAALAADFVSAAGRGNAEGTVFACSCFDASQGTEQGTRDFVRRYRAEYGSNPGYFTAEGYDAANALLSAIKAGKADRAGTPGRTDAADRAANRRAGEAINRYLATVDLGGASRRIRFAATGDPAEGAVYVYQVTGGRVKLRGAAGTATLSGS